MFETFYIGMAELFQRYKDEGKDCWLIIKCSVPCLLLNELYNKFVRDGVIPIEQLPTEKKRFYFDISCKYYDTTEERIRASKAAYVLALITSND